MSTVERIKQERNARKIIAAMCLFLAEGDVSAIRLSKVVRQSHMARTTFYATYPSLWEAIEAAFEFSAKRALYTARSLGLDGLKAWAEANPDQVRTILLAGPQINLSSYRSFIDSAQDQVGNIELESVLTVAAKHAREGRPIDGALIDALAGFCQHYSREAA